MASGLEIGAVLHGNPQVQEGRTVTVKARAKPAPKKEIVAKKAVANSSANKSSVQKPGAKKPGARKLGKKNPAAKKRVAKTPEKRATVQELAPRVQPRDDALLARILASLDDDKAEDVVTIDLEGQSSLADAIVIASGRSSRHVASIADHLARRLKEGGYGTRPVNGAAQGDWVLVDAGDVIVHVFRPEVRDYYDLEGMWSVDEAAAARAR